jgi:hypothetical protein
MGLTVTFDDEMKESVYDLTERKEKYRIDSIKFIIKDIYQGTEYNDICISEIKFYNEKTQVIPHYGPSTFIVCTGRSRTPSESKSPFM